MDNHEFDSALKDYVKSSELPYDGLQWDKMASRLKAHEERKVLPLPVPATGKAVPVYKWAAMAAAACMLVMLGWYINDLQDKTDYTAKTETTPINNNTNNSANATGDTEPKPTEEASATGKAEAIARTTRNAAQYRSAAQSSKPERIIVPLIGGAQTADTITRQKVEAPVIASGNTPVKHQQAPVSNNTLPSFELPQEEERQQTERKMAYGVNGGYNIGNGKGNFTVGVNVQRKLSKKLLFETGIAYVSGTNKTYEGRLSTSVEHDANGFTSAVTRTSYEPVSNDLHYIQAAPSLSYMVVPGLSAGGGVDAQRLLTKTSESIQINSLGEQEPSQPQWDFGVTARMDYQVIKKLKAGVMYRESVGAVSKGGGNAAKRNYLLMQLSYTLF
jgi:hypothetical protein